MCHIGTFERGEEGLLKRAITLSLLTAAILFVAASTPIWAQEPVIPSSGPRMPMPWGFGLTLYSQSQPYDIVELQVPLAGLDIGAAEGLEIQNTTNSYHFKFDYWVLPFLNIYALGGYIDGETTVKLSNVDLGLPILLNDLKVEYTGFVYGGGATLAVGGKKWFASLTYDATWTDLDVTSSSVSGQVLTPNVGLVFGGAAVWVGAMYQKAEETHEGIWEMPFLGEVPYYVELHQAEPWNYHIGMRAGIGKHWDLTFTGGFGKRKSALAFLGYRFGTPRQL
jgi:hypothetical protein